MKRWTLKLTLCLLAGAVVTWAVAWGCALWGSPVYTAYEKLESVAAAEYASARGFAPAPDLMYYDVTTEHATAFGLRVSITHLYLSWRAMAHDLDSYKPRLETAEARAGFPWAAMSYSRGPGLQEYRDALPTPNGVFTSSHKPFFGGAFARRLPARIRPLGFALDTFLYGGVVLGVVEGVGFAGRRRWRNKGRCAGCGYDRRGLGAEAVKCPECGRV